MEDSLKKRTLKNMGFAFGAQMISMCLSILMSLVVPKILGVTEFSYWQLFLFYATYVGFFHYGLTDGMYLKTGGTSFEKVNRKELSSQFWCLFAIEILNLLIIGIIANLLITDMTRKVILIITGIYMIIANLNWFLGYIFQATNIVKIYSISVMVDKVLFLIFIITSIIFKINNLKLFVIIYVLTTFAALLFSMYYARKIIFTKPYKIRETLGLAFDSVKIGINLTLASVSSLLILGIGRFLIDKTWGIEVFGKFSFALSLTNFFLLFIAQVSVVMFPTLRQVDQDTAKNIYVKFNKYLNLFLPAIYILYLPIKVILSVWLPQYQISLEYLALLLPICIFDGKMQMISNTYYKVLREEKRLLKVNLLSVLVSGILSVIGIYWFKSIYAVILGMILSIAIRSIISEIYLSKRLEIATKKEVGNIALLLGISIIFVVCSIMLDDIKVLSSAGVIYCIYLYFHKNDMKDLNNYIKIRKQKN